MGAPKYSSFEPPISLLRSLNSVKFSEECCQNRHLIFRLFLKSSSVPPMTESSTLTGRTYMELLNAERPTSPNITHSSPLSLPSSDLSSSGTSSTDSIWTSGSPQLNRTRNLTVCHFEEVVAEGLRLEEESFSKRNNYDYMRFIACGIGPSSMPLLVHHRLSEYPSACIRRFYGLIAGISRSIVPHGTLTLDPSSLWLRPLPEDLHLKHTFSLSGKVRSS